MSLVRIKEAQIKQEKKEVLSRVNMNIEAGDFIFLMGKTGSGKSSLLATIYADLPFSGEEGFVLDFDLAKLKRKQQHLLRRKVGFIFQDFNLLFDRNVYDNLDFVLRATQWKNEQAISTRIEEVLRFVDLFHLALSMPYELSYGQQQLVCIARALLNDPALIIADEPSANLDPETTNHIIKTLYELTKQPKPKSILLATHQYQLLRIFPSTKNYICENGLLLLQEN